MSTQHLIPGIYNYCDRWCERCPFIDRCALGAQELKRWADGHDAAPEDFLEELDNLFPHDDDKMPEWLEEFMQEQHGNETDPVDPVELPKPEIEHPHQELQAMMQQWGTNYCASIAHFLKANKEAFKIRGFDPLDNREHREGRDIYERSAFAEAIEVIMMYQYLMVAKAVRAMSGLDDMYDTEIWGSVDQSDANGSAKAAMIAAERSHRAWEIVLRFWPEKQAEIRGFLHQLNEFQEQLEVHLPRWRQFIRPGFDTEKPHALSFGEN